MTQSFFPSPNTPLPDADVVVVPIPYEGGISYLSGAGNGPAAIITASHELELYNWETMQDLSGLKICTIAVPMPIISRDLLWKWVDKNLDAIEPSTQFYLGIGGDHTVTIPAVEYFVEKFGEIGIVQIDAHADLRDSYQGNKFSHACIMRRVCEMIDPQNVLSIGIRAVSQEEHEFIQNRKLQVVWGNRPLHEDLLPDINEKLARLPDKVFLTVDLDGLDPSVIPHVGTPVPGGLSWIQTIQVINRLFERKFVVGADVVEIASGEKTEQSDFIAASLAGYIIQKGKVQQNEFAR